MSSRGPGGEVVRRGYDAIAGAYLESRRQNSADIRLLEAFLRLLPRAALVLDAGCGAGQPVTRMLAHRATAVGLDFAGNQVRLARAAIPGAHFLGGDMVHLPFASESFDGACSYYAIIHIPRDRHAAVLAELRRVLRPGGISLLCLGASDVAESREDYFGVPMYWSHFDAGTNLGLLSDAGFDVLEQHIVPDESSAGASHLFVIARRPA